MMMGSGQENSDSGANPGTGIEVEERTSGKTKRPLMYVVFVHNDPYTPRQFVVDVLKRYFQKDETQATKIMLTAHTKGMGAVAVYTHEIAEMRASQANSFARSQGHPLNFSVQEE